MNSLLMRYAPLCIVILFTSVSCKQPENKKSNQSEATEIKISLKDALSRWKQDLVEAKVIGSPCDYESLDDPAAEKWRVDNAGQLDGLPSDELAYKSVGTDLNGDGKDDLLLYFQGNNCTGHNGDTKTYAKIIYSDGSEYSDLMNDIIRSIKTEYNRQRDEGKDLKPVTDDYLETTTTITGYRDGIRGGFLLYTASDAHCCPSYNGQYVYHPSDKRMEISVEGNNE